MFTKKQKRIILISNVVISILIGLISQAPIVNTLIVVVGMITFYIIDLQKIEKKNIIEMVGLTIFLIFIFMIWKPESAALSIIRYIYIPTLGAGHIMYVLRHSKNW